MFKKLMMLSAAVCLALVTAATVPASAAEKESIFGMLLVGPYNDHGWSQAHYEAGHYLEEHVPGTKMIYIDNVNPAARPGVTIPQLVDDLVSKGAKLIIANSDEMGDGIVEASMMHPDVKFVHVSGDHAWKGAAPPNMSNVMGRMEYGAMIAGFSAALTSKTGKIGYLGPLINDETRRLAASSYLGAKYAWEKVLKKNPKDFSYKVTWIGFWFNIPGVTSDPTQVCQNFFNEGYDVVISGIDTTESTIVAHQKHLEGKAAWAIPYDYKGACGSDSKVCLGVPYYNWGPAYVDFMTEATTGTWKSKWLWLGPDWKNINDPDTSAIGFAYGPALSAENRPLVDAFIADLGSGKVNLLKGPLNHQDGTPFLAEGEIASDKKIWYMKQLLEGMIGQSSAK